MSQNFAAGWALQLGGGTRSIYRAAFRRYAEYTNLTAKQMIDEALEDSKRDVRAKTDILKTRLLGFHQWLLDEYPVKRRGKSKHVVIRKGIREKTARTYVMAVRSFYGTFDLFVNLKGRQKLAEASRLQQAHAVDATQGKGFA
jgi:hypothetical protein